jgi:hypothetical protein
VLERGQKMAATTMRESRRHSGRYVRNALVASLLAALTACGTDGDVDEQLGESESALTPLDPEIDDAVTRNPWSNLGVGVSYKGFAGVTGTNALLVYGGYTAQDEYVQRWANQLVRVKGAALGIRHLYAVRGPNQSGYANREIQNSKLAAHLGAEGRAATANAILVVAHSSGTYVADELFGMLKNGSGGVPQDTLSKVRLFNLDGGGVASASTLNQMARAYFVYAHDPAIGRSSHNASGMKALGQQYASIGGPVEVNANRSGCSSTASGGLWCLHDALINTRPHDPTFYDLRNDYTDFTNGGEVVTSYFDDFDTSLDASKDEITTE